MTVSVDSTLKVYDVAAKKQVRSLKISNLALSSLCLGSDSRNAFIGSWDNNMYWIACLHPHAQFHLISANSYVYSVANNRVMDTLYAHDDALSCLAVVKDTLVTGSWDTTIKASHFPPHLCR